MNMPLSSFLGNMFTGAQLQGQTMKSAGLPAPGAGAIGTGAYSPGVLLPAVGRAGVARPAGMPDYEWWTWQKTGAASGLVAITSAAGNPSSYTQSANTVTADRGRGRPWVIAGWATSLTKCRGAALIGNMSYGGDPAFFCNGNLRDPMYGIADATPKPLQEGEIVTGYIDNMNTAEQGCMSFLVTYGSAGHKYPTSIEEVIKYSGLGGKIKEIWEPRGTTTASVTVMTGGVALGTACSDTKWIDSESQFYILGAKPFGVASVSGFFNFSNGLPEAFKVRNNLIPFGDGLSAIFDGPSYSFPYHAIGPFSCANYPLQSALGTAAAASIHTLVLAKC